MNILYFPGVKKKARWDGRMWKCAQAGKGWVSQQDERLDGKTWKKKGGFLCWTPLSINNPKLSTVTDQFMSTVYKWKQHRSGLCVLAGPHDTEWQWHCVWDDECRASSLWWPAGHGNTDMEHCAWATQCLSDSSLKSLIAHIGIISFTEQYWTFYCRVLFVKHICSHPWSVLCLASLGVAPHMEGCDSDYRYSHSYFTGWGIVIFLHEFTLISSLFRYTSKFCQTGQCRWKGFHSFVFLTFLQSPLWHHDGGGCPIFNHIHRKWDSSDKITVDCT